MNNPFEVSYQFAPEGHCRQVAVALKPGAEGMTVEDWQTHLLIAGAGLRGIGEAFDLGAGEPV